MMNGYELNFSFIEGICQGLELYPKN